MTGIGRCFFCLPLVLAAPCFAQSTGSATAIIQPSPDQQSDNKVICKSQATTGSRFPTRACHTNKQWADIREQSIRDMAEETRDKFGSDDSHDRNIPN